MLSLRPLPVAVVEESSMKSAATMASNTNMAPNRNGAPENWNRNIEIEEHNKQISLLD